MCGPKRCIGGQCLHSIAVITLAWYARNCGSIPREGSLSKEGDVLRIFVVLIAIISLLAFPSVALADFFSNVNGNGPHNHNGNTTMDFYVEPGQGMGQSVNTVIADFNDTRNPNDMPLARRVQYKDNADVWIHRNNGGGGALIPHHASTEPDEITIDWNVDGGATGERVYVHEMYHAYSGRHMTDEECALSESGSVMCSGQYNPNHLTIFDGWNLRRLPNEWQGGSAVNSTMTVIK